MKGLTRATLSAALSVCTLAGLGACNFNLTEQPLSSRVILDGTFKPAPVFKNVNLLRSINLEKGFVRETVNVQIENVHSKAQDEYYVPFSASVVDRVGGLEVRDKKEPNKAGFEVALVEFDPFSPTQFYRVRLPEALKPKDQVTLSISYWILSAFEPLPAAIEQLEKQYLAYHFSAYTPSAYETSKQKTKVKFLNVDVPDFTTLPAKNNVEGKEDPQRQGSTFVYGPYSNVPAGVDEPVRVRYEFTKPVNHVSVLERDLEVSQWGGNLATEERYQLTNKGARLSKNFNRAAWATAAFYNPTTSALRELRFPLHAGASDPYYTDDIGNVSTSRFRSNIREATLELKPRYPLFGGWRYKFRVGWNAKLEKYLRRISRSTAPTSSVGTSAPTDGYILKVPFLEGPRQPEGVEYEKVIVRVTLPEGATNVRYQVAADAAAGRPVSLVAAEVGLHKTFLDTLGRTTLTLVAVNLVDDASGKDIYVTYSLPLSAVLRKPLTIVTGLLGVFVTAWFVGKIDTSIGRGAR